MLKREYDDIVYKYYKKFFGNLMIKDSKEPLYLEFRDYLSNELIPLLKNNISELSNNQLKELRFILTDNFNILTDDKYPIIEKDVDTRKFVIISDTHFGCDNENLEYIKRVIEFCDKNEIKHIFHAGDFIEGTYYDDPYLNFENRDDLFEEIYDGIEKYPKSDITTHLILGNHDVNAYNNSYNCFRNCRNNRYLAAYKNNNKNIELDGVGILKYNLIGRDKKIIASFNLEHCIFNRFKTEKPEGLIIHGHEHRYYFEYNKKKLSDIYLPPLCDLIKKPRLESNKSILKPGFLVCEITGNKFVFTPFFFNNKKIEKNDKMRLCRLIKP